MKKINDREDISSYGFLYSIGYVVFLRSLCCSLGCNVISLPGDNVLKTFTKKTTRENTLYVCEKAYY